MMGDIDALQRLIEQERPKGSDAIVWLQGDRYDRGEKVLGLFQKNFASFIFLTGNNELLGKDTRPGEDNVSLSAMAQWLMDRGVPEIAIHIDDRSMNTREQAIYVMDEALTRAWKRILLVGSRHHQARPFLTFLKRMKEVGWDGEIVNQPAMEIGGWQSVPGGRNKTMEQIFQDEVEKLKTYRDHVASVADGIQYLYDHASTGK